MVVGVSVFELHLPYAQSLKGKRKVVKSLVEKVHSRFRVSIAETGFQDLHQRAEISLALVAQNDSDAERMLDALRDAIFEQTDAMVLGWDPEILEMSP
ncbi:MAG: DUF503 domain-containing protein [Acidobacteriota bacterium]